MEVVPIGSSRKVNAKYLIWDRQKEQGVLSGSCPETIGAAADSFLAITHCVQTVSLHDSYDIYQIVLRYHILYNNDNFAVCKRNTFTPRRFFGNIYSMPVIAGYTTHSEDCIDVIYDKDTLFQTTGIDYESPFSMICGVKQKYEEKWKEFLGDDFYDSALSTMEYLHSAPILWQIRFALSYKISAIHNRLIFENNNMDMRRFTSDTMLVYKSDSLQYSLLCSKSEIEDYWIKRELSSQKNFLFMPYIEDADLPGGRLLISGKGCSLYETPVEGRLFYVQIPYDNGFTCPYVTCKKKVRKFPDELYNRSADSSEKAKAIGLLDKYLSNHKSIKQWYPYYLY